MKNFLPLLLFPLAVLQANDTGFSFYSGPLLIKPYSANQFEPRLGTVWELNHNRIQLDIGNSIDLLQYRFADTKKLLTIGNDFFTYTMLVGEKNFHFPVIAVDYLFGINVNLKDTLESGVFGCRLRLSHISAHFVDGHYDGTTQVWKDGIDPHVYSREFFDLSAGYEPGNSMRIYAGIIFLYHVDPATIPALSGYTGIEYHVGVWKSISTYGAYQFSATGLRPRHEIHAGLKIGNWYGRGALVYYTYHHGNSIHGEYYNQQDNYSGISFSIDL